METVNQPRNERRAVRWSRITMVATALAITGIGIATTWAGHRLDIGTLAQPGPGLWPGMLGIVLTALGMWILVFESGLRPEPAASQSWRVFAALGLVAAYIGLFSVIGPSIPTFALVLVWLRRLSAESWRSSIIIALVTTLLMYVVFVVALDISFPADLLWQ